MTQDLSLSGWPLKGTDLSSVDETSWYYRRCLKIESAVSGGNKLRITWAVQTEVHWPPLRDDGAEIPSIHGKVEPTYSKDTSNRTLILLLGFPVIFGSFSPLEYAKIILGPPRSWRVEGSPIHKRGQQQHLRGLFPYGPTQVAPSMSINISQIKYQSREPKWTMIRERWLVRWRPCSSPHRACSRMILKAKRCEHETDQRGTDPAAQGS